MNISLFYRVCELLFPLVGLVRYFHVAHAVLIHLHLCCSQASYCCCFVGIVKKKKKKNLLSIFFNAQRIHFAAGWNHTREQASVHPELQMD